MTDSLWMRFFLLCLFVLPLSAKASEYSCDVSVKRDYEYVYPNADLRKWKWSVKIVDNGSSAIISRCSFSTAANSVTCDDYPADFVHQDPHTGMKKYYYLRGHLDVQLFSDLSFIENNWRGSISRGKCVVTKS